MNTHPPQSPHVLDAEERAVAKHLPRLHGRMTPGPDLDASILASAQAAVQPAKPARANSQPRIRWIAPASLAASVVLAVGMAWQLRPLPTLQAPPAAAVNDTAVEQAVRMIEPAASNPPAQMKVMPPTIAPPAQPAREQATAAAEIAQDTMSVQKDRPAASPVALPPPPPAAPPAPPAPIPLATMAAKAAPRGDAPAGTLQTQASQDDVHVHARAAAPAEPAAATAARPSGMIQAATADKASVSNIARPATTGSARAATAAAGARTEATMAADASLVDDPEEDIPPATVASPDVRDAWLRRITQLLEQGKRQDAKASLVEFKRRYPSAVLPSALKAFDLEP